MLKWLSWTTIKASIIFISCIAPMCSSYAEIIQKTLDNKLIATAEFHQGEANAPGVLILHGFLQTRESHTVNRLYNALVDSDYTVLAPTLSLGINQRKQSLACEAIHSHTMESDIAEIDLWSKWLQKKTRKKIILIGHSTGSVQQLSYLNHYSYDHIDQGIFISLGYFGKSPGSNETEKDGNRAKSSLKQGNNGLDKYGLSYCKEYVTTPGNYLSYFAWRPEKLLATMKKIKLPITVIIGSKDKRISKNWGESIKDHDIKTITVEGAGHFFDEEYEFDLQDLIESIISKP